MSGEDEEVIYASEDYEAENDDYHNYDDSDDTYNEEDEFDFPWDHYYREFADETFSDDDSDSDKYDNASSEETESEDDEEEDDDDEDGENRKCAVCFKKNKSLVVLPCCGSNEVMSSTRFCETCMVKCLQSQQQEDYYRDPYRICFHSKLLVGECPRCRQLISICAYTDQRLVEILKATFQQSVWFADRNDSTGRTRFTLMTAAYMNPKFLPLVILGDNADRLRRLCEWKILQKTDSKVMYTIDPLKQEELKNYVTMMLHLEDNDDDNGPEADEHRYQKQVLTIVSSILFIASRKSFAKYQPIMSLRLLHRGIYFGYQAKGFFPLNHCSPLEWWQEAIVVILNIFLVITIPTILFTSFCAIQLVSFILRMKPQRIKSGCMVTLVIMSYQHKEFLSQMGYLLLATCTSSKPDVLIEPSIAL